MSKPKIKAVDLSELFEVLSSKRTGKSAVDSLGEDVPSEVKDALMSIIEGVDGGSKGTYTATIEAQAELLRFMSIPIPKVGAFVERNDFGEKRYKSPSGEGEAAIVLEVFPCYEAEVEGHGVVNGIIGFCNREGIVRSHTVDLRMYKEVEVAKAAGTH